MQELPGGRLVCFLTLGVLGLWEYARRTIPAAHFGGDGEFISYNGDRRLLGALAPVVLLFSAINTTCLGFSLRFFNRQLSDANK